MNNSIVLNSYKLQLKTFKYEREVIACYLQIGYVIESCSANTFIIVVGVKQCAGKIHDIRKFCLFSIHCYLLIESKYKSKYTVVHATKYAR